MSRMISQKHAVHFPGPGLRAMLAAAQDPASELGFRGVKGELASAASLRFTTVHAPDRLSEILALRRAAFGGRGRPSGTSQEATPETHELTDPRDEKALFVVAESRGEIVASVRLGRPLAGPLMHHTSRFQGAMESLPPRSKLIESSRACIHPTYQGRGLFWHLVAHMLEAATTFHRPYLVAGTESRLWPYWRRCGFSKIGATYRREGSAAEFLVVVLELRRALAGRGVAPELARLVQKH